MLTVQFGEDLAKLKTQRPKQNGGLRLDDGHLVAIVARRCSRLQADPSTANNDDPPAAFSELRAQRIRIIESAQVVNALEVSSGDVDVSRRCAGRKQQLVEVHATAVVQFDLVRVQVERYRLGAGE